MRVGAGGAGRSETERGSVAIEAAMLVPVFIVLIALVVAAGRVRTVDGAVAEATRDAARAASLVAPADAVAAGQRAGAATLSNQGLTCQVSVVPHLNAAPGQVGTVQATILCEVPVSDLLWSGLTGHVPVKDTFTSVVDSYRSN
ncbi:pilus assembly protein [Streptacidiphilus sp. PB12-B1b]|uniref:TadE/TadG family type IV pilus assembly protein n=1 Tax=Streptacidiphilus sp. PB12-B1b TaxID=2705012 RepID=UPI0015FA53FA|nr:TadE family protein [Streptacidiphilus sp. PB12-B1b]QMU76164.1 pilus assembly protein [Streptacidiphilus sp. PB12-B1b]